MLLKIKHNLIIGNIILYLVIIHTFQFTTYSQTGWIQQASQTTTQLNCIHFENSNVGYAGGDNGIFLKTINGGAQWNYTIIDSNINVETVFFVNASTGWIGCTNLTPLDSSQILKTTDGGSSWVAQKTSGPHEYTSIFFIDNNTGWAVSEFGHLVKTTNGGNLWVELPSGESGDLHSVCFVNSLTGWIAGINNKVKKSIDGGSTWISQTLSPSSSFRSVYFANSQTGWVVGLLGRIFKTTDGGSNWIQKTSPVGSVDLFSVHFSGTELGWVAGNLGRVIKTTNGGESWYAQSSGVSQHLRSVFMISPTVGLIAGYGGTILKTTNSGESTSLTSQTIHRYNINKPIIGGLNTYDTINVSTLDYPFGIVQDVNVYLDTILNSINSDLEIALIHQGVTDTIVYRVGGNGSNFYNTVLNDSASIPIEGGTPPFTGQFRPSRPLAQFINSSSDGDWILRIYDRAKNLTGVIKSWGITVTYLPCIGIRENNNNMPDKYSLSQNYPNPFNPVTNIKYQIPKNSFVTLKVYDVMGREVRTLLNEVKASGSYSIDFNASDLSSGVYFYKIQAGEFSQTKKMMLIK